MSDENEKKEDSSKKDENDKKERKKESSRKKERKEEKKKKRDKDEKKSSKKSKKDSKKKKSKKDSKDPKKKRKSSKKQPLDESISTLSMIDASERTAATVSESMSMSLLSIGKSINDELRSSEEIAEADDDAEMRALLESFAEELGDDDDSSTSSGSSTCSGLDFREVDLQDNVFDHMVLAAPELDGAIAEFLEKTGVEPVVTGSIKGLGIKTAWVTFEGSSFLEIIAPDPERPGPIGTLLTTIGLTGLVPFHWAIRTLHTEKLAADVPALGFTPDLIGLTRARHDGTLNKCDNLYLYGQKLGGMCPFFVNYESSGHPCETAPIVGNLIGVKISAPENELIHKLINHAGSTGFTLAESSSPHFEITFDTPNGEVSFESTKMTGFRFPGYEEEMGPIVGEEDFPEFVMPETPKMAI